MGLLSPARRSSATDIAGAGYKTQNNFVFTDQYWDKYGPIFFYTGNEGPITGFWDNSGFVFEAAEKFSALVIFGEHVSYQQFAR